MIQGIDTTSKSKHRYHNTSSTANLQNMTDINGATNPMVISQEYEQPQDSTLKENTNIGLRQTVIEDHFSKDNIPT